MAPFNCTEAGILKEFALLEAEKILAFELSIKCPAKFKCCAIRVDDIKNAIRKMTDFMICV